MMYCAFHMGLVCCSDTDKKHPFDQTRPPLHQQADNMMMWSENWGSIIEWAGIWTLCLRSHQVPGLCSHTQMISAQNSIGGQHRAPQSYNKHRSVHLSALLRSHQIHCGSNFLQDQVAKSFKLIRFMRSLHNTLNPPHDSVFCMKL